MKKKRVLLLILAIVATQLSACMPDENRASVNFLGCVQNVCKVNVTNLKSPELPFNLIVGAEYPKVRLTPIYSRTKNSDGAYPFKEWYRTYDVVKQFHGILSKKESRIVEFTVPDYFASKVGQTLIRFYLDIDYDDDQVDYAVFQIGRDDGATFRFTTCTSESAVGYKINRNNSVGLAAIYINDNMKSPEVTSNLEIGDQVEYDVSEGDKLISMDTDGLAVFGSEFQEYHSINRAYCTPFHETVFLSFPRSSPAKIFYTR